MKSFKAGKKVKQFQGKDYHYESFLPSKINKPFVIQDQEVVSMLEEATKLLSELNFYAKLIPDIEYFIQMHVRSEAVSSSKIEGTKTGIDEALLPEKEISPEHRDDWQEVQNYIKAMNWAVDGLKQLPVSERLIRGAHKILLSGVRGEHRWPGEIRESQNWIGGSTIRTAHFIPPHHEKVPELLSDWEGFWHNKNIDVPVLIKIAIGHYQFETIHPFLDGNGRIGRLLISLQLIESGFTDKPALYLSNYFEKNRQAYYDSLNVVRAKNDLEQWIKFFLEGVILTAQRGKKVFEEIVEIKKRYECQVEGLGRKTPMAREVLLLLFSNPVLSVNQITDTLDMGYDSANALVKSFEGMGILKEITGRSRNRVFKMTEYIDVFKE